MIDEQVNEIQGLLFQATGYGFSDHGRTVCKRQIKEFGFMEVYEAAQTSLDQYYKDGDRKSVTTMFNKIGGICYNRRKGQDNGD